MPSVSKLCHILNLWCVQIERPDWYSHLCLHWAPIASRPPPSEHFWKPVLYGSIVVIISVFATGGGWRRRNAPQRTQCSRAFDRSIPIWPAWRRHTVSARHAGAYGRAFSTNSPRTSYVAGFHPDDRVLCAPYDQWSSRFVVIQGHVLGVSLPVAPSSSLNSGSTFDIRRH